MVKVLHLSKYYPPVMGGIETFLFDLNEALYDLDEELISDVLAVNEDIRSIDETTRPYLVRRSGQDIKIFRTPFSLDYKNWLRANAHKYHIIHLHYPNPFADLSLLLSGFKGKLVCHWHSDIFGFGLLNNLYAPLRKWMMNRADAIIATSPIYAQQAPSLFKYKNKIEIIPLGLNPNRLSPSNEAQSKAIKETYSGKKIIFSLGRQVKYKGFDYLIRSAKHLPEEYVILIGGRGPELSANQGLIKELGLTQKVKMLGFLSDVDVSNHYKVCSIYVMSSVFKSEAFGVVQLEAMFHGKPIVSTRIPCSGVSWVNKHEESGLIVKPKDPKALAEAVVKIVGGEQYEKYSINAKKRFETHFTAEKCARSILALYKNLLKNEHSL